MVRRMCPSLLRTAAALDEAHSHADERAERNRGAVRYRTKGDSKCARIAAEAKAPPTTATRPCATMSAPGAGPARRFTARRKARRRPIGPAPESAAPTRADSSPSFDGEDY